jgi:hypothetical protein
MTDCTKVLPLSSLLTQLRTQSTIYVCHETRHARSLVLKDDPRPSVVRVLSLLPGFSLFVPKYDPTVTAMEYPRETLSVGDGPEDMLFKKFEKEARPSTSTPLVLSQGGCLTAVPPTQTLLATMVTTAATATVIHAVLFRRLIPPSNPFQAASTSKAAASKSINCHSFGSLALPFAYILMANSTKKPQMVPSMKTSVLAIASSIALLFGTREVLLPQHGSLPASIAAGIVAGFPILLRQPMQRAAFTPTYILLPLARYTVGAVAYFGVYDYTRNREAMWQTAMAGSLAGYAWGALITSCTAWRVAPTHALVWCAFEKLSSSEQGSRSSVRPLS